MVSILLYHRQQNNYKSQELFQLLNKSRKKLEFLYDLHNAQNSYDIMCVWIVRVPTTNSHVTFTMPMMSSVTGAFGWHRARRRVHRFPGLAQLLSESWSGRASRRQLGRLLATGAQLARGSILSSWNAHQPHLWSMIWLLENMERVDFNKQILHVWSIAIPLMPWHP